VAPQRRLSGGHRGYKAQTGDHVGEAGAEPGQVGGAAQGRAAASGGGDEAGEGLVVADHSPSNIQADLRDASATAGFDWIASHFFRKIVATLMDHAGLSPRAAADQLGHANTSMTTDVYFGRKVASTGAAAVLEALST
jgi:integrase